MSRPTPVASTSQVAATGLSAFNVYLRTIKLVLADAEQNLTTRETEALFDIVHRIVERDIRR